MMTLSHSEAWAAFKVRYACLDSELKCSLCDPSAEQVSGLIELLALARPEVPDPALVADDKPKRRLLEGATVGSKWKTRDGDCAVITKIEDRETGYPVYGRINGEGAWTWSWDGEYCFDSAGNEDIIAPWPDEPESEPEPSPKLEQCLPYWKTLVGRKVRVDFEGDGRSVEGTLLGIGETRKVLDLGDNGLWSYIAVARVIPLEVPA